MAVLQKVRMIAGERLDLPDLENIQNFVCVDFAQLFDKFISNQALIIKGFEILNPQSLINTLTANGLSVEIANSALFHSPSAGTGGGLYVGAPTESAQYVSLTAGTTNYIEIDQTLTEGSPDTRKIFDPDKNVEYEQIIDTVTYLDVVVTSNTIGFTAGRIPIAKVVTSVAGVTPSVITSITDCRRLLFRLGTGGALPDPLNDFTWPDDPSGYSRIDSPVTLTASSPLGVNPFRGSDKNIYNFKNWADAVMTRFKEITGSAYWFAPSGMSVNIQDLWWDAVGSEIVGTGTFTHDAVIPGKLTWSSDIFVMGIIGNYYFRIPANNVTLANDQVAYLTQVRNQPIPSGNPLEWIVGFNYVNSGSGLTGDFAGLVVGDFIKNVADGIECYSRITDFKAALNGGGASTTAALALSVIIANTYPASGTSGVNNGVYSKSEYTISVANRASVPNDADVWWLAIREDSGGVNPLIYLRNANEVEMGESEEIGDETSLQLLAYIGAPNEADDSPDYVTLATGVKTGTSNYNTTNGENLTIRSSKLTSMVADKAQDKTVRLRQGGIFTWDFATNTLTWTADIIVEIPSSTNNNTIAAGSAVIDANGKVAYFSIDRNAAGILALTVATEDSVPLDENTFVLAQRGSDKIYLMDGTRCDDGTPTEMGAGGGGDLWKRIGTTITPTNVGDNVDIFSGDLLVDTIIESTLGNGVDIEGVHFEDNEISSVFTITLDNPGVNGGRINFDGLITPNYIECADDGTQVDWYLNNYLGTLYLYGDLDISDDGAGNGGNLYLSKSAYITGSLNVTDVANFADNVNVSGNLNLSKHIFFGLTSPHIISQNNLDIHLDADDDDVNAIFKIWKGHLEAENFQSTWAYPKQLLTLDEAGLMKRYGNTNIGIAPVNAIGSLTLTGLPALGETFNINGTIHTIVAAASGANQITLGTTIAQQVDFIAGDFATWSTQKDNVTVTTDNVSVNKFIWRTPGVAGNAIVFSEALSNATMDGAGFFGGTQAGADEIIYTTLSDAGSITLDYGAVHGGQINFNGGAVSYLQSTADGLTLNIAGFTSILPTAHNAIDLGGDLLRFKDIYYAGTLYGGNSPMNFVSKEADGATAIGFKFNTSNALTNAAAKLWSLQNNSVEKIYADKDGGIITAPGTYSSNVADGALAIGFTLNTLNALTTPGAKLWSLQNNSGEKVYFDKDGRLAIGTPGSRMSLSSGSAMAQQIYVEHIGLGAGEYLNGLGIYAYVKTAGNATAYARGLRTHLGLESGGLLSEAYGAYFSISQADGSKIADHAYGALGHVNLAETDLADLPTGMVVGLLGLYDVDGTDPNISFAAGTYFMAAMAGVVASESKAPHAAVMAILQGDSASDIAVPAAFKAVAERTTAGKGFNYGLDLKTEAGLCENINTADIRGSKGNIWKNLTVDQWETDADIIMAATKTVDGVDISLHDHSSGTAQTRLAAKDRRRFASSEKHSADSLATDTLSEHMVLQAQDAITITKCFFMPDAALVSNDADYAILTVYRRNSSGGGQVTVVSINTKTLVGGGSGDWTAFDSIDLGTLANTAVAAGEVITIEITKAGNGVAVPAGKWQIEYTVD